MPGNFGRNHFANSLQQISDLFSRIHAEIRPNAKITAISGQHVKYHVDDPNSNSNINYILYMDAPGVLSALTDDTDNSSPTGVEINNPNGINLEFRTWDWDTGSPPTATISLNSYPNNGNIESVYVTNNTKITFILYKNPGNPNQKHWYIA